MYFSTIAAVAAICGLTTANPMPVNGVVDKPAAVPEGYFSLYAYTPAGVSPSFTDKPVRPYSPRMKGAEDHTVRINPEDADDYPLPQYRIVDGSLEVSGPDTLSRKGVNPYFASLSMGGRRGGGKKAHQVLLGREGQTRVTVKGKKFQLSNTAQFGVTVDEGKEPGIGDADGPIYALTYGGSKDVFVFCPEVAGEHGDLYITSQNLWNKDDVEDCWPVIINLYFGPETKGKLFQRLLENITSGSALTAADPLQ